MDTKNRGLEGFWGRVSGSRGQSILQVVVALGLMTIITLGFTQIVVNQQKSAKALADKLNSLALKNFLISVFSTSPSCSYAVNSDTANGTVLPLTFNSSSPTALQGATISVNQILTQATSGAPKAIVVGGQVSADSPNLKIASIKLTNFVGSGTFYRADWVIGFTSPDHPLAPITIPVNLTVNNGTPTATSVSSCLVASGSGSGSGTLKTQVFTTSGSFVVPPNVTNIKVTTVGGGGGGGGGTAGSTFQYQTAPALPDACVAGAGGGGGATSICSLNVAAGANFTVTVGAGGTGGSSSQPPSAGGNGGSSSVIVSGGTVASCQAGGGLGGPVAAYNKNNAGTANGVGGSGGIGDSMIPGSNGLYGPFQTSCASYQATVYGGPGGSAFGGHNVFGSGGNGGNAGDSWGLGGYPGQDGAVIIEWTQ